jgi:hypothetical protein
MTIYILDNYPVKCAQYLDDKSLYKMIRDIAQALCNVHHMLDDGCYCCDHGNPYEDCTCMEPAYFERQNPNINFLTSKLNKYFEWDPWSQWTFECKANYKYLLELGISLCDEHTYRFYIPNKIHTITKYENIISWCKNNYPDLPLLKEPYDGSRTQLPLVIPKKYLKIYPFEQVHIIESYRNYYKYKYEKSFCGHRSISMTGIPYFSDGKSNFKWTRRQKPEWINL